MFEEPKEETILGFTTSDRNQLDTLKAIQQQFGLDKPEEKNSGIKRTAREAALVGATILSALGGADAPIGDFGESRKSREKMALKKATELMAAQYGIEPDEVREKKQRTQDRYKEAQERVASQGQQDEQGRNTQDQTEEKRWLQGFAESWNQHFDRKKANEAQKQQEEQGAAQEKAKEMQDRYTLTGHGGIWGAAEDLAFKAAMLPIIGFACLKYLSGKKKMPPLQWKPLTSRKTGSPYDELVAGMSEAAQEAQAALKAGGKSPTISPKDLDAALDFVEKKVSHAKLVAQNADKCKARLTNAEGKNKGMGGKSPARKALDRADRANLTR